jgi:hypothetical protein
MVGPPFGTTVTKDWLKALTKLGIDHPKAENEQIPITQAEGKAFAIKYLKLKASSGGFLDNNHAEKCRDFVADNEHWCKGKQ